MLNECPAIHFYEILFFAGYFFLLNITGIILSDGSLMCGLFFSREAKFILKHRLQLNMCSTGWRGGSEEGGGVGEEGGAAGSGGVGEDGGVSSEGW